MDDLPSIYLGDRPPVGALAVLMALALEQLVDDVILFPLMRPRS
jgi:hypothetical protein